MRLAAGELPFSFRSHQGLFSPFPMVHLFAEHWYKYPKPFHITMKHALYQFMMEMCTSHHDLKQFAIAEKYDVLYIILRYLKSMYQKDLSKENAQNMSAARRFDSSRPDVAACGLPPRERRQPGAQFDGGRPGALCGGEPGTCHLDVTNQPLKSHELCS